MWTHEGITGRMNALFDELVPAEGRCDTLAGELVRACNRIGYRYYNDGDICGVGYGNITVNPAVRFIAYYGDSVSSRIALQIFSEFKGSGIVFASKEYENMCDALYEAVIHYIDNTPELRAKGNVLDMLECKDFLEDRWEDEWDYYEETDYDDDDDDDEDEFEWV